MTGATTLIMETGLFEDAETLRAAIEHLPGTVTVQLTRVSMNDQDWDDVLNHILEADRTVTI